MLTISITILFLITTTQAYFTADFREFLLQTYGVTIEGQLERLDLYAIGSFGGKLGPNDVIKNRPIVFVHGSTLTASMYEQQRRYFMQRGYNPGELYATTFGDAATKKSLVQKVMDCEDVKQIRQFIGAVSLYTNSTVDIMAYSMGTAISRKAILGGSCVDTNEYLGPPLTYLVHTFVAAGGVAYGLDCQYRTWEACSELNGMSCTSKFMQDVNAPDFRYEGKVSYGIYSRSDPVIGDTCCGHFCAELKNANQNIERYGLEHLGIVTQTIPLQYDLFTDTPFPILSALLGFLAFFGGYLIGVLNDHEEAWFSFISDGGTTVPESCIFGILLTYSAFFWWLTCFARHYQLLQYVHFHHGPDANFRKIIWPMLITGLSSGLGTATVANFQETRVPLVHSIGALLSFLAGMTYIWFYVVVSFAMKPRYAPRGLTILRMVVAFVVTVALVLHQLCLKVRPFVKNLEDGSKPLVEETTGIIRYKPDHYEYLNHLVACVAEWTLGIGFFIIISSLSYELGTFEINTMTKDEQQHVIEESQKPVLISSKSIKV
ncbi:unnamed protein product [Bursaphelenchus okinawaensis]|uniref:CWH43-like N-terminal domain-containing protein n=1 Tax=Bursaphelenchus okinawaensis TaxID=465554 RepID=A0A811L0T1_9BILA|nr:unnamed protein product [Bursaphelenchus okinawaensis]CAG9114091.1 unnamed protein product [Bursaphelenchus okinawaensis]